MKRTHLATLSLVFTAFLVGALVGPASTSGQPTTYRLAVFDAQRVISESSTGQKDEEKLNHYRVSKQAVIDQKQKELEQIKKDLQSTTLSMTTDRKDRLKKEIEHKQIDLKRFISDAERELRAEIDRIQRDIQKKLAVVINNYGKKNGYTFIFERNQCAFNDNTVDITDLIIKEFDNR
jgi:outer membrane protein